MESTEVSRPRTSVVSDGHCIDVVGEPDAQKPVVVGFLQDLLLQRRPQNGHSRLLEFQVCLAIAGAHDRQLHRAVGNDQTRFGLRVGPDRRPISGRNRNGQSVAGLHTVPEAIQVEVTVI